MLRVYVHYCTVVYSTCETFSNRDQQYSTSIAPVLLYGYESVVGLYFGTLNPSAESNSIRDISQSGRQLDWLWINATWKRRMSISLDMKVRCLLMCKCGPIGYSVCTMQAMLRPLHVICQWRVGRSLPAIVLYRSRGSLGPTACFLIELKATSVFLTKCPEVIL